MSRTLFYFILLNIFVSCTYNAKIDLCNFNINNEWKNDRKGTKQIRARLQYYIIENKSKFIGKSELDILKEFGKPNYFINNNENLNDKKVMVQVVDVNEKAFVYITFKDEKSKYVISSLHFLIDTKSKRVKDLNLVNHRIISTPTLPNSKVPY